MIIFNKSIWMMRCAGLALGAVLFCAFFMVTIWSYMASARGADMADKASMADQMADKMADKMAGQMADKTPIQSAPYSFSREEVNFPSQDGLLMTADFYAPEVVTNAASQPGKATARPKKRIIFLLSHQTGASRGEYRQIGQMLAMRGYYALAVDQRAGGVFDGVPNKTLQMALHQQFPITQDGVYGDMLTGFQYIHQVLQPDDVIIWGSSYTASLAMLIAAQSAQEAIVSKKKPVVSGVIAFSPGEAFDFNPSIKDIAKHINVPVFISSARDEAKVWKPIFAVIPEGKKRGYVPAGSGAHGSAAMISTESTKYWHAVNLFLAKYFPL